MNSMILSAWSKRGDATSHDVARVSRSSNCRPIRSNCPLMVPLPRLRE